MRSRLANSRTGTAIVYASIAGARRILGMAITVPTAHIFGPVFYGQLNIATTLLFLVSTLFALGLELIVFRAAAQEDADSLNATGWLLRFISPAVGVGLALLVWLFEWHIYGLSPLVLSLVLMTSSFTPSNSAFFNSLTRSRGQLETFISRNVILLVLGTGLKAAFILVLHGGLVAWMMIELVTAICGWIFAVVSLAQTRPAASATKAVLATSLPLLPHTLMHWIVGTSDRLLIASFMGVKSLGIYAATYTVPSFLGVALGELNSAFMSSYAKDAAPNGYI
ncbi:MAG: oligosaccharide flippase family protein, partial [Actinomycetales bacterium]|nr:oligosaccharide flippase family protein [Actinomycetales bacterium]